MHPIQNVKIDIESYSFGQKVADKVTSIIGSWNFILIQSIILVMWIVFNTTGVLVWDKPPFILLNLILSFQAAYTAPMIMMSQNCENQRDRLQAAQDYQIDIEAEKENKVILDKISQLEQKIDQLLNQEFNTK